MGKFALLVLTAPAVIAATLARPAYADGGSSGGEVACVTDVRGQFRDLEHHGEALGFHLGAGTPDPSLYRHYQGIQRLPGAGTPYFFVTRSGNDPGTVGSGAANDPGDLLVVRFDSRDKSGERVRSNRLRRGQDSEDTAPPVVNGSPRDRVVANVSFDGTGWPNYGHPGGAQLFGDVLVVPLGAEYGAADAQPRIVLVDVASPESPVRLRDISLASDQEEAGAAAIVRQSKDRLLLVVSGNDDESLHVYESNVGSIRAANLRFTRVDVWKHSELVGGEWATGDALQHLYLVRDCEGTLYMLGTLNDGGGAAAPDSDDRAYLYEVGFDAAGEFRVEQRDERHLWCTAHDVGRICDFAAAGGFHVTPAGELILYASEHANGGPGGTVRMAEFRSATVFRPGSANLAPKADAGGPYNVAEGGSVSVSGAGTPPLARAWAELYEDTNFRDRSIVFDWDDRLADDFDDFDALDGFGDEASSLIFRAPVGCSLQLYADRAYGGRRLVFNGTGGVVRVPDLHAATYGFGDQASSVQWVGSSCPATALGYVWFPGGVQGSTAALRPTWDGPSDQTLLLQVCGSFLACSEDEAALHVRNVAPVITSLTVPATVAEGARIDVTGSFTDPGSLDRVLTVTLEWGDGSSDSFTASSIASYHRYAENGTKSVRVRVCDELACDTQVRNVTVTNVAPTVSAGSDATVAEGLSFSPGSSFSDPGFGPAEGFTASIDWGDGTTSTPRIISVPGAPLRATIGGFLSGSSHRYGDDGTYTITVTVTDDDGGAGSDTLVVTVTNAAPVVGTPTLRDEAGRVLGSGETALAGLRVDLAATLTDGTGDTDMATISWGDGQTSAATVDQATHTARGSHVYANIAASRTVTLSAADDNGASGQASAQLAATDAAGALAAAIDDLRPLSNDPTVPAAAHQALRSAVSALEGSNGGAGNDGAVDWLAAGDLVSALDRIQITIQHLQSAEAGYPALDAAAIEALLTLTAKSVTVDAIADAQPLATTSARQAAIVQATTLVGEGDALLAAGDRLAATRKYLFAVRVIATYF